MSFRQEMIQMAARGIGCLGERAALVRDFLLREQNADGGFHGRGGPSELCATAFGLQGLMGLWPGCDPDGERLGDIKHPIQDALARVQPFLQSVGDGPHLDLRSLAGLARAWAVWTQLQCQGPLPRAIRDPILSQLELYRAKEGGYHVNRGSGFGSAQGCYLAAGVLQDLGTAIPDPEGLVRCVARLQVRPGVFANLLAPEAVCDLRARIGSTLASAAAVAVLQQLGQAVHPATGAWLLRECWAEGGFLALPSAPLPDLWSTASALQTLGRLGVSLVGMRQQCQAYVDSLWSESGGFLGHAFDVKADAETTFAGLVALGCLVPTA